MQGPQATLGGRRKAGIHGVVVMIALLGLVVGACGTTGTSPAPTPAGSPSGSAPAATSGAPATSPPGSPAASTVRLGVLPLADVAPVHLAIKEGHFQKEGLTIELKVVQGGAAAIPALVSGDLDITFGNYVSFFLASSQGVDLRIIAEQNRAKPGFSRIMTLPASGITNAAGLVGKRLAVNTLANIAEISSRAQIKDAGVDPNAVEYVEIPFPDMIATLERGDVDAIFAVEPFATLAVQQLKAVEIADPYGGRLAGFPVAGFQATTAFTRQRPEIVAAFQRAMIAASGQAAGDPKSVVGILPTYTTLTPELAGTIAQPQYVSQISVQELTRVVQLMVEGELLETAPDVNGLIVPTG